MKRAFDILAAALGMILLSPLFILVALMVRREDGGPVFYRQTRVGRRGRPFRIWKFRTMVAGADRRGPLVTAQNDSRTTRTGRWLRRFKLDELPQLINVLRGEMSLVGPRPEVQRYVDFYDGEQRQLLNVRPGITDPACLEYFDEEELLSKSDDVERTYIEEIMPEKIRINLAYAAQASLGSDLVIILRTLRYISGRRRTASDTHRASNGRKQAA